MDRGQRGGSKSRGNWRSRRGQSTQGEDSHQSQSSQGQGGRYIPRNNPHNESHSSAGQSNRGRNDRRRVGSGRIQIQPQAEELETNYQYNNMNQSQQPRHFPPQQGRNRQHHESNQNLSNQNNAVHYEQAPAQFGGRQGFNRIPRNQHETGTNSARKQQHTFDPLCYTNLVKLVNSDNNVDIVHVLANSQNGFEQFIEQKLRADLFVLIMKALSKVCNSDLEESKRKVLNQACTTTAFTDQFINQLMVAEKRPSDELKNLILNYLTFFETIVRLLPLTACDTLKHIIYGCFCCAQGLNATKQLAITDQTLQRFKIILDDLEVVKLKNPDMKELQKKSFNERLQSLPPPNDFREISVYPTSDDVLNKEKPFLRPNIVKGPYDNIDHYLDVHFRLLKEDFVRPLREGIEAHLSGDKKLQKNSSVRVYRNVYFIRSEDEKEIKKQWKTKEVEGTLVKFDSNKKYAKVDWEHNRRFMHGSLLCFSKDNFNTLLVTTVSDRDVKNLEQGLLRVEFCQEYEENIYNAPYSMLETEVFFDPYFHVLKTMKTLTEENFPMKDYLIGVQEEDYVPKYLEADYIQYRIPLGRREEVPIVVLNRRTWPSKEELDLDSSQFEALHAAMTRELVVIQGPPGTGKTFIGLKIAEILIRNKEATGRRTPILVVCLTNHALDQFLMGIRKFTDKIVRIGGQSKCEEMAQYNLRFVRRQTKSREYMKQLVNLKQEIGSLYHDIAVLDSYLRTVKQNEGIVSFETFHEANILPPQAVQEFNKGNFLLWLLEATDEQQRKDQLELNGIRFELLLEEFTNKYEELEQQKASSDEYDLQLIEYQQEQISEAKDYILIKFQNKELATEQDVGKWLRRNLWNLDSVQKWKLYFYWLHKLEEIWQNDIRKIENLIIGKNKEVSEMQMVEDLEVLRGSDVIGMTTTGAARLHSMLRKLGPEIVIVEEAAEVMEAHVVACLTQQCQHLILIGDHKQLRPNIAVYHLGVKYNFDVSLFERMVMNRGGCVTLGVQHRMAPEIAKLITPSIYKHLANDCSVTNYPEIPGFPKRLYFITHNQPEQMMDVDSNSRINKHEADFIIALCRHLVLQGVKPTDITILATYRGQMFHIRKEIKTKESIKSVNVTVVDNYQGEENKVILLSLVRSNSEKHIGFLATENRVCVALSRAQHAMYVIGNMTCLEEAAKIKPENNVWVHIKASLEKQTALGPALPLRCQVHPEQHFSVGSAKEFSEKAPEGGCNQICTSELECGHPCGRVCHALTRDHVDMKCLSTCDKICNNGKHKCTKKCYEPCGECTVNVEKTLPCGHKMTLMCHVNPKTIRCTIKVEKTFVSCNHRATVKCYVDPETGSCPLPCDSRLECGHQCIYSCHANNDPDHLTYICKKPCAKNNKDCSQNHKCGKICCDECSACKVQVPKKRSCGHSFNMECSADPEEVECRNKCSNTLICGHQCRRKCCEPCGSCKEIVQKRIPNCGHYVEMQCGMTPMRSSCTNMKCDRRLSCLHHCTEPCGKPCTTKCMVEVAFRVGACGHQVPLLCWEHQMGRSTPSSTSRCARPCNAKLECGHMCPGTCGKCFQGRYHELCDQPCGRVLVCGHSCKEPCAEVCPPCKEKCTYRCQHSKCSRKCGEPCVSCKEACKWRCEHSSCRRKCGEPCDRDPCDEPCKKKIKCGHDCVGFCGEPCPSLCRICDKEELTDIFFGTEDEPDARYVLLPDCRHIFEADGLKTYMQANKEEITMKTCPKCKSDIIKVPRFNNEIKQVYNDICKVKAKTFGNPRTIDTTRAKLEANVITLLTDDVEGSFVELHWCLNKTLDSLKKTIGGRKNVLNSTSIAIKGVEVDVLTRICEVWNRCKGLPENSKEELKVHVNLMLDNLESKKHRMGQQQVKDFDLELLRLQRVTQYLAFKSKVATHTNILPLLETFRAEVLDINSRFSEEKNRKAEIIYQKLKENTKNLPGLGIDEYERKQIVGALNLQKGHWFRCPNGHPYIITECGGAMVESTCPDCGAEIGGRSHRLRDDNAFFSLMDQSNFPRWSEQANNMANFDFGGF